METDEIVTLTCHRRALDDEVTMYDMVAKRLTSARSAQFSQVSSLRSASPRASETAAARAGIMIQTPTTPRPVGSIQTRTSSYGRVAENVESEATTHCTS